MSARTSVTQYLSIVFSLLAIVSQRNHQSKLLMLVAFIVFSIFILNADRMSLLTFLPAFLLCYLKCGFKLKLRYFLFGGVLLTVIQSLRIGADFNIGLNSFYLLLANPRDTLFSSYLVSEVVSKCGGERSDYLLSWIVHIFSIFSEKPTYITDTYACNDIPGGGFAAGYYFMFFGDWFIILMPFLTYMFLKIPSLFSGYERSFLCLVGLCSLIRYLYYGPVALPKYILVALFVVFFLRLFIKKN
ncbi:hypothetical protein [Limnobacter sp.]|uniref:hypothetical protein n=1 Tax=Limnobacter sp. TaxID=2003368 RepID=UPI00311F2D64